MRILDSQPAFRNPWARKLESHYGQLVPSVLVLGLEPEPGHSCAGCPADGDCPREGSRYRDLTRSVAEGFGLGIRLFLVTGAAAGGVGRYWQELVDLALRNPECTFVVLANGFVPDEEAAKAAATSGNLAFAFPTAPIPEPSGSGPERTPPLGRGSHAVALRDRSLATLRAAGAPFGFVAGLPIQSEADTGLEIWMEEMLGQGCLFGLLCPLPASQGDGLRALSGPAVGRLRAGCPLPLLNLQEEAAFTDETGTEWRGAHGSPERPLLVHAVSPRVRTLTLLESIEAASARTGVQGPALPCPLLLGHGNTRGVLYALVSR